jgi:hypothetical protein
MAASLLLALACAHGWVSPTVRLAPASVVAPRTGPIVARGKPPKNGGSERDGAAAASSAPADSAEVAPAPQERDAVLQANLAAWVRSAEVQAMLEGVSVWDEDEDGQDVLDLWFGDEDEDDDDDEAGPDSAPMTSPSRAFSPAAAGHPERFQGDESEEDSEPGTPMVPAPPRRAPAPPAAGPLECFEEDKEETDFPPVAAPRRRAPVPAAVSLSRVPGDAVRPPRRPSAEHSREGEGATLPSFASGRPSSRPPPPRGTGTTIKFPVTTTKTKPPVTATKTKPTSASKARASPRATQPSACAGSPPGYSGTPNDSGTPDYSGTVRSLLNREAAPRDAQIAEIVRGWPMMQRQENSEAMTGAIQAELQSVQVRTLFPSSLFPLPPPTPSLPHL